MPPPKGAALYDAIRGWLAMQSNPSETGLVMPMSWPGKLGSAPQTFGPLIFPPRGRDLTAPERYHEGFHAGGGLLSMLAPRALEENAAYTAEQSQFPDSENPYQPKLASPEATAAGLQLQEAQKERMRLLMEKVAAEAAANPSR